MPSHPAPPSMRSFPSHLGFAFPTSAALQTKEGQLDTNLSQATWMNSPNIHEVSYISQMHTNTKLHGFHRHLNLVNLTRGGISQQRTCLATLLSVLVYPFLSGICRKENPPQISRHPYPAHITLPLPHELFLFYTLGNRTGSASSQKHHSPCRLLHSDSTPIPTEHTVKGCG